MEDYSRDQLLSAITKHKTINAIKRNLGLKKKKEVVALFRKHDLYGKYLLEKHGLSSVRASSP